MTSLTRSRCHSHRVERPSDQGGNNNFLEERGDKWPTSYFSHITKVRKRLMRKPSGDAEEGDDRYQLSQTDTKSHFNT